VRQNVNPAQLETITSLLMGQQDQWLLGCNFNYYWRPTYV